jgi:diguanylate cyclase (GGDEF)-like protein/PAS domain S-box-containing protein
VSPAERDRRRRVAVGAVAAMAFTAVFAFRFAVADPNEAITLLYVFPIALVAVEFGTGAGLGAAALAFALFVVWDTLAEAGVGTLGFLNRAVAFALLGAVVGRISSARRHLEAENRRQWELSLDLMCTADLHGRFLRVNPAFERVLGYGPAELTARPFVEFVHPEDREKTLAESARLAQGQDAVDFQNRYLARDGTVHWLEWRATMVPDERLIYAMARDISDRKVLEARLADLARQDALTGLLNRRGFGEAFDRHLAQVRRYWAPTSILAFDLDGFKGVNDRLGHAAGDEVLVEVAACLRRTLREPDVAGRLGGDEFVVVLPHTARASAEVVAGRLVKHVAETLADRGVTASVGVAVFDAAGVVPGAEPALAVADAAMYDAKRQGRNRFVVHVAT